MSEFSVGDKVRLKDQDGCRGAWKDAMEVIRVFQDGWLNAQHPTNGVGGFRQDEIEHVEAFEIPKDFRFFRRSDGAISQAPYPTFEAALEGWRGFAQNGDQTEIVELVSHGTYKATLKVEVVEPISEEA